MTKPASTDIKRLQIGMAIVVQDALAQADEGLCAMLGRAQEELTGQGARVLYADDEDHENAKREIERQLAESGSAAVLARWARSDGVVIVVQLSAVRVDPGDGSQGTALTGVDVTAKRQTERERLLDSVVQELPDIVYRVDANGALTFVNDAVRRYGYDPDELIGASVFDIIHPDDRAKAAYQINERRAGDRRTRTLEIRLLARTAEWRSFELVSRGVDVDPLLLVDSRAIYFGGAPSTDTYVGAQGVARDITERKRAEEALRRESEFRQGVMQTSPAAILVVDPQGRVMFANSRAEGLVGLAKRDPAQPFYDETEWRITDYDGQPFPEEDKAVRRVLRTGGPVYDVRYAIERPDGSRAMLSVSAAPQFDDSGVVTAVVVTMHDVTERMRAEQALRAEHDTLQALMDGLTRTGIGVDIVRSDHTILSQNKLLTDRFGDAAGRLCYATYMGQDEPCERCPMVAAIETNSVQSVELLARDGRHYELMSAPLPDSDGTVDKAIEVVRDITEKKEAAEELRQSEERFRQLAENIGDVFWIGAPDWNKVFYVSPAYERVLGRSCQSLLDSARSWIDAVLDDDREGVVARVEARAGQTCAWPNVLEYRITRPDGSVRWIRDTAYPVRDELGVAYRFAGIAQDITERKRAEEELRYSEERFRRLSEASREGVVITERGIVVDVNEAILEMYRIELDDMVGKSPMQFVTPECRALVERNIRDGYEQPYEQTALRSDGSSFPIETCGRAIPYHGRAVRVTTVRDMTEQRDAAESLRKWGHIFEHAGWGIAVGSSDGNSIDLVNPAFARMHGYDVEELTGTPILDVYAPDDRAEVAGHIEIAHRDGHHTFELMHVRKDGTTFPAVHEVTAVKDEQGEVLYRTVSIQDITERRQLELQFLQAQKMEAVGLLAGGVAHDFNNQLMVIMGYSQLQLAKLAEGDPSRDAFDEIYRAGDRAGKLTSQLLAFSRKQVLRPQVLDLDDVMATMRSPLARLVGEHIEVRRRMPGSAGCVRADRSQLEQAIMNLAINARDAMPAGGTMTISAEDLDADDSYVRRRPAVEPGKYVMLSVGDDGTGMDEETLGQIFEPFFTTKESGKGTGLGLSMVYGFVKQSAGAVDVESTPGVGTTFRLYFPKVTDSVATEAPMPSRDRDGTETILFVEDEHTVRQFMAVVLRDAGYTVLETASAAEALPIGENYDGKIDLLLSDVVMRGMRGPELAAKLRQARPEMRVLLISGYAEAEAMPPGLRAEGVEFLGKPIPPGTLLDAVRRLLDRK